MSDHRPSHRDTYTETYAGLPVACAYEIEDDEPTPLPDPASVAWRFEASEWNDDAPESISESFDWFFENVDPAKVQAIVIGEWEECYDTDSAPIIARLAENAGRLPALRSLFLGAITPEQAEISWIQQSDITPLLEAFPRLERLEVRGGTGLRLAPVRHESLRVLRFETGGLPAGVVRAVGGSDLPALEHLELWFGVEEYGGDATTADCAAILSGERLPALRHLGLQNSPFADELAAAVAGAPVVARLESLSLSMGSLGDEGAAALLSGQPLTHLRWLDLDHHYLSTAMMERLAGALPGVEVRLSEPSDRDEDWRYVQVSE
ncbi:STM4015 family protein [Nonomuraea candida]|uniref:STM4015 family protein n=1 Tax=Nonomuraea candida TaxID=359159 RepID=UPI0005B8F520|nr:STM4015 family protein [Nonomuraea candida]